ncbi:MAG: hypothetical protein OEL84_00960 [Nitrosopumilus sp.]|nr:hypothetical protein [Nitrosopumilus sp.]
MNPKSYGKKCKCGHFESDHVNLNKKFYEPNAILKQEFILHHHLQLTILKLSNVEGVRVTISVQKNKDGIFGNDN